MNMFPLVNISTARQLQFGFMSLVRSIKMIESSSDWAGNYIYRAVQFHRPETIEQIQKLVVQSKKLRALRVINQLREHIAPLLQISEIRSKAADDRWGSLT